MKVRTFGYFIKEAGNGLMRNGLMALAALGTITISLLVLGCFYILVTNFSYIGRSARDVIEIKVFLAKDQTNYPQIYNKLMAVPGVAKVRFVSKEEGARMLEKVLGNKKDLFFSEDDNPLPDSFVVKLQDRADVEKIAEQITEIPGVDEVYYGKTFVDAMMILVHVILAVGIGLIILMILAVLYIVVNTIQLTVFARRKEIEIMKLVGATDWFIRWPFILEGIMLGLGGAIIAVLLLSKAYHFLYGEIRKVAAFIPLVAEARVNNGLILLLVVVGVLFGMVGSFLSVKRYLKV